MRYGHVFAVCAYKNSLYLEQCIRSLKAQTVPSHTIICASTPSNYIGRLAWRYGLQVCTRWGESGIKDDWNFAYSMAGGESITIMHQDDMYHRDYNARLPAAHRRYPDMTVLITDYVIVKQGVFIADDVMPWIKQILRAPPRFPQMSDRTWIKKLALVLDSPICCPATAYHETVLGEPFVCSEHSFALDWDDLVRLAKESGRFTCDGRPPLYYRVHEDITIKTCIRDNHRFTEEWETFYRFQPEPVADIIVGSYKKAYGEYEQQFPGLGNWYRSERKMQG